MALYGVKGTLKIEMAGSHLELISNNINDQLKTFTVVDEATFDVGKFAQWAVNQAGFGDSTVSILDDFTGKVTVDKGMMSSDGRLILDVDGDFSQDKKNELGEIENLGTVSIGVEVERLPVSFSPTATVGAKAGDTVSIQPDETVNGLDLGTTKTSVYFNDNEVQPTDDSSPSAFKFVIPAGTTAGNYTVKVMSTDKDGNQFVATSSYKVNAATTSAVSSGGTRGRRSRRRS